MVGTDAAKIGDAARAAGEALRDMGGIATAMKSALAEMRGKCPECGRNLVSGIWLKWCSNLACQKFVGPR